MKTYLSDTTGNFTSCISTNIRRECKIGKTSKLFIGYIIKWFPQISCKMISIPKFKKIFPLPESFKDRWKRFLRVQFTKKIECMNGETHLFFYQISIRIKQFFKIFIPANAIMQYISLKSETNDSYGNERICFSFSSPILNPLS